MERREVNWQLRRIYLHMLNINMTCHVTMTQHMAGVHLNITDV